MGNWMRQHVHGPKGSGYAARVLDRYRLGMRAGGAVEGVQIITGQDSCPLCASMARTLYDPDEAPLIPLAGCTNRAGCRCAYAAVMAYDLAELKPDHRRKLPEYGQRLLARYRLGIKAGGAIGGIRVVAGDECCTACHAAAGQVYQPDCAPLIPIADCTTPGGCRCVYATVMAYQLPGGAGARSN
jgi:hypothetical protein